MCLHGDETTMHIDFSGQNILVTGATRGIGKAIADLIHAAGGNLVMTGTRAGQVKELNDEVQRLGVKRKCYVHGEFSQEEALRSFLRQLPRFFPLHAVINNAGINRIAPAEEIADRDFDEVQRVNVRAPLLICREVIPRMKDAGYGRIVNVASIWSAVARPGRASYTISKCGLDGMTRVLAAELAPHNVLVNTLSPGFTLTELTESTNTPAEIEAITARIPLKRMARPEEIAAVALFLASSVNSYITGQNIFADGGYINE